MREIVLDIPWDERRAELRIVNPSGVGDGLWHIYLDKYYHGQVVLANGELACYLNERSELTYDDQEIIKELITERIG